MAFDLDAYVRVHLAYEMKYLLVASTSWSAVQDPQRRGPHAPHLVVMAMESTFVHTRVLYEFLQLEDGWAGRSPHSVVPSELWVKYKTPLHEKVLHPSPRRPHFAGTMAGDDLKDRVLDFAVDILSMWRSIAVQPPMATHRVTMMKASDAAVAEAEQTAAWFRRAPLFR